MKISSAIRTVGLLTAVAACSDGLGPVLERNDGGIGTTTLQITADIDAIQTKLQLAESELASWSFVWIAPNARDVVMMHVAANSANGDNSPLGDLIYTAEARSSGRDEYR